MLAMSGAGSPIRCRSTRRPSFPRVDHGTRRMGSSVYRKRSLQGNVGSEHARRSATVCGLPVAPAYVLDDPKHLDTNGMAYVMGEGIPRVQEGFAMKKSIVAVIVSLAVAPVAARAFTLTSGQPVGSDISLVA